MAEKKDKKKGVIAEFKEFISKGNVEIGRAHV